MIEQDEKTDANNDPCERGLFVQPGPVPELHWRLHKFGQYGNPARIVQHHFPECIHARRRPGVPYS